MITKDDHVIDRRYVHGVVSSRKPVHLNYNHLHYFHVAAVEGSVGGAAQHLGVTQPTISEQLRSLERALGVVLFERQSSGLKLTEAGRLAFKHTSVMFSAGERLAAALDVEAPQTLPLLRVGLSHSIARASSADLLTPLLAIDCLPSVQLGDYVHLVRELRGGRIDIVLCDSEPPKSERRGFELAFVERTTLAVVTRPPRRDWSELSLLHYRSGIPLRWDVDAYLEARGLRPRIAAESDDAWLLVDAVTHGGDHVAIVPMPLVHDAIASGTLALLDTFESEHAGLYAIYPRTVELVQRAVQRLVDHVRARGEG